MTSWGRRKDNNQAYVKKTKRNLNRITGSAKPSTGKIHLARRVLNRVTIMELKHSNGKSYSPKLYQVNLNGKGMYFPAVRSVAEQQAKQIRQDVKSYNARGIRY